jgi:hypothetical protein
MRSVLATIRYWLPLVAACACLLVARWTPPAVTLVLIVVALGLVFDVGTALFAKAGGTGGLSSNRQ